MRNEYSGHQQAAIWRKAIEYIRDNCDDQREIIDTIVAAAQDKIDNGVPVKCRHCSDTGYEDVRGMCPCRNKCQAR
jgi:hypothetical protein